MKKKKTMIASKFLIQRFQAHPTQISCWISFLFHPTFRSYDIISNVRSSNREWFNKAKTHITRITHIKWKWAWARAKEILTTYWNCRNNMGRNMKMLQKKLNIVGKKRQAKPKKVYKGNWKRERLRKLGKMGMTKKIRTITKQWISCPSPSLIWHRMKEWKDLHIEWKKLDST